jgi:hypothetical protein
MVEDVLMTGTGETRKIPKKRRRDDLNGNQCRFIKDNLF